MSKKSVVRLVSANYLLRSCYSLRPPVTSTMLHKRMHQDNDDDLDKDNDDDMDKNNDDDDMDNDGTLCTLQ